MCAHLCSESFNAGGKYHHYHHHHYHHVLYKKICVNNVFVVERITKYLVAQERTHQRNKLIPFHPKTLIRICRPFSLYFPLHCTFIAFVYLLYAENEFSFFFVCSFSLDFFYIYFCLLIFCSLMNDLKLVCLFMYSNDNPFIYVICMAICTERERKKPLTKI